MPWEAFRSVVDAAASTISAPGFEGGYGSTLGLYFIVNAVAGLEPGAYYYNPFYNGLRLLKAGDFREMAGHLGFEQALPADAAAVAFITADLNAIDQALGARGYRTAQTIAGIIGGRLYLGMHALGLGATGLTFYDDSVTEFFSPHAAGQSAVFVVPMGVQGSPNRVRPFPFTNRSQPGLPCPRRGTGGVTLREGTLLPVILLLLRHDFQNRVVANVIGVQHRHVGPGIVCVVINFVGKQRRQSLILLRFRARIDDQIGVFGVVRRFLRGDIRVMAVRFTVVAAERRK